MLTLDLVRTRKHSCGSNEPIRISQTFSNGSKSIPILTLCAPTDALRTCSTALASTKRSQISGIPWNSLRFRNYFHDEFPFPRSVKLAEENALPASQHQASIFHEHDLAAANKHGLHMRV